MPHYVDGFLIPIPARKIAAYRRIAKVSSKIWLDHGALDYRECVGEDLAVKMGRPFTEAASTKKGETVVFAYIVFKSRAHRDRVNAKVMKDPRMAAFADTPMPFDCARIFYGGFKTIVGA